jgi:hypothetical protein
MASALTGLLEALAASHVDFILVGGLAAVAQGAPIVTFDVDVVHHRTEVNVDRLLGFLAEHDGRYRGRPAGQVLRATKAALLGPGHSLMMTDLGPLDLLGTIEDGLDYQSLDPESLELEIGQQRVKVLRLERIVALKRSSIHPKDRRALPILEATLARIDQGKA